MSEARGSERVELRGEFARAFLEAVHYSGYEISMLGDLSRVSSEQVKALLNAKVEEMRAIEDVIKNPQEPRDFKLLGGGTKNK